MTERDMEIDGGRPRVKARVPVDYPSNSQKSKTEGAQQVPKKEGPRQSVINGRARMKRPRGGGFFQETGKSLGMYILNEVIVPNIKSMIVDVMTNGSERAVWGNDRPRGAARGGGPFNYTAASRGYGTTTYPGTSVPTRPTVSKQNRAIHNFAEIVLETREEAERVFAALDETIAIYNNASVADYLELCGFESNFTEAQWGWTSTEGATIHAVRGGYMIKLPRTVPLSI